MPRKCSVGLCTSNYLTGEKNVTVFCFPKGEEEQKTWVNSLPNKIAVQFNLLTLILAPICFLLQKVTPHMGVCSKHWPRDTPLKKVKRSYRPIHCPSIFPGCPSSMVPQTFSSTISRHVKARRILLTDRGACKDELDEFLVKDRIPAWNEFKVQLKASKIVTEHDFIVLQTPDILLVHIDATGEVDMKIKIDDRFAVSSFKWHTPVSVRDLLGFQQNLKYWSQLEAIIVRVKTSPICPFDELSAYSALLRRILSTETEDGLDDHTEFLLEQIDLRHAKPNTRRYSPFTVKKCIHLHYISTSCYQHLREFLALPHPNGFKKIIGGLTTVGSLQDCRQIITNHFSKFTEGQTLQFTL